MSKRWNPWFTAAAIVSTFLIALLVLWQIVVEPYHRQIRFVQRLEKRIPTSFSEESNGFHEKLPQWLPETIRDFLLLENVVDLDIGGVNILNLDPDVNLNLPEGESWSLSKADFQAIARMPELAKLNLNRITVPETGFAPFDGCDLESLILSDTNFSDEMVSSLALMSKMSFFMVIGKSRLTSEGICRLLEKTPDLAGLFIEAPYPLDSRICETVGKLENLRRFTVWAPSIEDGALRLIAASKIIKAVELHVPEITDDDLRCFENMSQLNELRLHGGKTAGGFFESLGGLPRLRRIGVVDTPITDENLVHLTKMPELSSLTLEGTRITDDGLRHVGKIKNLGWLFLTNNRIGDEGLTHLRELPKLRHFSLWNVDITDAGLELFAGHESVFLTVSKCPGVTKEALERLRQSREKKPEETTSGF